MSSEMNFDLLAPASVAEAVAAMKANPGARYLAGGTDAVPNFRRGIAAPPTVIALDAIDEMKTIGDSGDHVVIGAAVTLAELAASDLPQRFPALSAAAQIAGPGLREAATVGGNLCLDTRCVYYNQSRWWRQANSFCLKLDGDTCHVAPKGQRCHAAYSGDLAPALLVLGAEVRLAGSAGSTWKPLAEIYNEDGRDHLALKDGELLVAVRIPVASASLRSDYLKTRTRKAIDFPLAGVAVALELDGTVLADLRVAVTGTNPRPLLFDGFDELKGRAIDEAALSAVTKTIGAAIKPMRTTNVPGLYRRQMVEVLTRRLIANLGGKEK